MDFTLSEEQKMLQSTVRDYAANKLAPIADELDLAEKFPMKHFKEMAELGLVGMSLPLKYNGGGISFISLAIALEEIARRREEAGPSKPPKPIASTTDPEARLFRKGRGKEAKLCFMGHVITENRNGLVVATETTLATGAAEREASVEMMKRVKRSRRSTLGGDKHYDTQDHVASLRALGVTPHVAQNNRHRRSAIDDRTTTHTGYEISQRKRKCVEQVFGWGKMVGAIRKAKHRGRQRVGWMITFTQAAYNLVRMRPMLCPT